MVFHEDITQCCMNCERLAGELVALKTLVQHYQDLAKGDECPYDKGECDGKAALKALVREIAEVVEEAPLMSTASEIQAIFRRPEVVKILKEKNHEKS